MATEATWVSISFGLPSGVSNAVEGIQGILQVISTVLEVTSSILDIIKIFIIDVNNPLSFLVSALLTLINNMIEDLSQSGLYLYVDGPFIKIDKVNTFSASNLVGGLPAWRNRMSYAFLSPGVPNQPNFSNSATIVSFHLLVTSGNLADLYSNFGFLMALFNERIVPNLNPPRGVSARVINSDFFDKYYDASTGRISDTKVAAQALPFRPGGSLEDQSLADTFMIGGPSVNPNNVELVTRYDLVTGEELIIDKKSGAVFDVQNTPNAALITWKVDSNLIPNRYEVQRSTMRGGAVSTEPSLDSEGNTISTEVSRDQQGNPEVIWEDSFEVAFEFGFGKALVGRAHEQLAYLDTDVDRGRIYYYRVVPVYGLDNPLPLGLSAGFIGNSVIKKAIRALLLSLEVIISGRGEPSEIVSTYIPNEGDDVFLVNMALLAKESDDKGAWHSSKFRNGSGWARVGVVDTIGRPLMILIEALDNFAKLLEASIQSGASEMVAFIELLQTKINTLNTFIEMLQALIAVFQVFELISFNCLFVTTNDGIPGVLSAINDDSLEGVPTVSDSDFVASVTILGGTGAGPAISAVKLLFGIT